jgi:hypothetical protein
LAPTKDKPSGLPCALTRAQSLHWRLAQILGDRLATADASERPSEVLAQLAVLERALADLRDAEARAGRRYDQTSVAFLIALLGREPG